MGTKSPSPRKTRDHVLVLRHTHDPVLAGRLVEPVRKLIEVGHQGAADWCGEQRAFHLPRVRDALTKIAELLPMVYLEALKEARDAYGDLIHLPEP